MCPPLFPGDKPSNCAPGVLPVQSSVFHYLYYLKCHFCDDSSLGLLIFWRLKECGQGHQTLKAPGSTLHINSGECRRCSRVDVFGRVPHQGPLSIEVSQE